MLCLMKHSSRLVRHPGVDHTVEKSQWRFWWLTIKYDAKEITPTCTCSKPRQCYGPLRPLPTLTQPWSHIVMDFITELPASAGNTVIYVIIDRFSKACSLTLLKKSPSSMERLTSLAHQIFKLYGLPQEIVSSRGTRFTSSVWKTFCKN